MKKAVFIITSLTAMSFIMNIVDGIIAPPYFIKSLIKILLFVSVPAFYFYKNKDEIPNFRKLFVPEKKTLCVAFGLGAAAYAAITGGYLLLKDFLGFSGIAESLTKNGITAENFIFVAIYISFCNSLLEEIFYRAFGFAVLKNHIGTKTAAAVSAGLFAFYHIGMTLGWVEFYLFALGFAGLLVGGIFFNYLCEKTKSIYPSWILHMFINFGINTVGFMLFEII